MRIRSLITLLGALLVLGGATDGAWGQMFGNRQTGSPLTRQAPPGFGQDQENVGTLQGNERFIRRNRRATDFVGPDLRELQRFIGILQATPRGRVAPTTDELRRRVDRSESINQPLAPAPRGQMYSPRLEIDFTAAQLEPGSLASNALDTLARSPQLSGTSRIAVWVADRTAILQGEVPSAEDRDLAEVLLAFEPGISAVRNDLVVNPNLRPAADSLQLIRDRQTPRQAWTTLSHGSRESTRSGQWNHSPARSY